MAQAFVNDKTNHVITPEVVNTTAVFNFPLLDKDSFEMLARATVIEDPYQEHPVLFDIVVYKEENRRKHIADELMSFICRNFKTIVTGYHSKAGLELCLKHGFVLEKAINGKQKRLFYQAKEVHDGGKENSSGIQEGSVVDSEKTGSK